MNANTDHIAAIATAVPPNAYPQEWVKEFLLQKYAGKLDEKYLNAINKVFSHPSVQRRCFALDDPQTIINENPDERIGRFTEWAVKLSSEAIRKAIAKAGLEINNISALVVNTCTGYLCPGISTYVLENLGLDKSTKIYDLAGSGCGGAIPNMEICRSLLNHSPDNVVVSVSVEICTCTYRMENDMSLVISNALFSDGAAAAVLWNRPQGLSIVTSRSLYEPQFRDDIRFIYKDGQLYNQLSVRLPFIVGKSAAEAVNGLLQSQGLKIGDVKYWAVHPGGEYVIDEVKYAIGLTDEQIKPTREVLANFGNISSPTVWFVLNHLQESGLEPGNYLIMLAFGAGLSAHTMLLRT